jgi:hypothetical protein
MHIGAIGPDSLAVVEPGVPSHLGAVIGKPLEMSPTPHDQDGSPEQGHDRYHDYHRPDCESSTGQPHCALLESLQI